MIDFDSVLAEARTLATFATGATTCIDTSFKTHSTPATTLPPTATNQSKKNANADLLANVANGRKQQIDLGPTPINESSKVAKVAEATANRYCDERTFDLYGNQMANERGLGRVYEVHQKALKIGIHDEQAWDFAEAIAVSEFSGDNRRACLECSYYRHKQGSDHGLCTAAGVPPLESMTRGASVNWYWMNRCKKHSTINPATKTIT